jgi:hypothetical protein
LISGCDDPLQITGTDGLAAATPPPRVDSDPGFGDKNESSAEADQIRSQINPNKNIPIQSIESDLIQVNAPRFWTGLQPFLLV